MGRGKGPERNMWWRSIRPGSKDDTKPHGSPANPWREYDLPRGTTNRGQEKDLILVPNIKEELDSLETQLKEAKKERAGAKIKELNSRIEFLNKLNPLQEALDAESSKQKGERDKKLEKIHREIKNLFIEYGYLD